MHADTSYTVIQHTYGMFVQQHLERCANFKQHTTRNCRFTYDASENAHNIRNKHTINKQTATVNSWCEYANKYRELF